MESFTAEETPKFWQVQKLLFYPSYCISPAVALHKLLEDSISHCVCWWHRVVVGGAVLPQTNRIFILLTQHFCWVSRINEHINEHINIMSHNGKLNFLRNLRNLKKITHHQLMWLQQKWKKAESRKKQMDLARIWSTNSKRCSNEAFSLLHMYYILVRKISEYEVKGKMIKRKKLIFSSLHCGKLQLKLKNIPFENYHR